MEDLKVVPTHDLIAELCSRSEDFLILRSFNEETGLLYEFEYSGDANWILKKLQREIVPDLEDELEEQENDDEDE